MKPLAVLALGGNALISYQEKGSEKQQLKHLQETAKTIQKLHKKYQLVITHGNGPQVGNLLLQQEYSRRVAEPMPLHVCDAMTQGQIGSFIKTVIPDAVTIITHVLVDKGDPAFKKPTKPIGPTYPYPFEKNMVRTTKGWRRVVPSPYPQKILEINAIRELVHKGYSVIAAGGGGIPVTYDSKRKIYIGTDAVIDKDYAAALLGKELRAKYLFILTDTDYVYLNYHRHKKMPIKKATDSQMRKWMHNDEFEEGSMKPKVKAAIDFVQHGDAAYIGPLNMKKGTVIL